MATDDPSNPLATRIRDRLAADARTVEFGIDVVVHDDVVVLRGQVATARRRALIEAVARESASGLRIANNVTVVELPHQTRRSDGRSW
jgi:osmotically-inducible protein OsmY